MKRLLALLVVAAGLSLVPAAAASPTVRLVIMHVVSGCHVWGSSDSKPFGPTRTITVAKGTKLEIRINCPMAFDVTQLKGPKLLQPSRWETGTSHSLTFKKAGVYVFTAKNVQSSAEMNLQTLGDDNVPRLTVRVR